MRLRNCRARHFHLLARGIQVIVGATDFQPNRISGHFLYGGNFFLQRSFVGKLGPLGAAFEEVELDFNPG